MTDTSDRTIGETMEAVTSDVYDEQLRQLFHSVADPSGEISGDKNKRKQSSAEDDVEVGCDAVPRKKKKALKSKKKSASKCSHADKVVADKGDVTSIEEAAKMLKKVGTEGVRDLGSYIPVADLERGDVLLVTYSREITTQHGFAALLNCVEEDGVERVIMAPARFSSQHSARLNITGLRKVVYPAILINRGPKEFTKSGLTGRMVHRLDTHSTLELDYEGDISKMIAKAKELRSMSRDALLKDFEVITLGELPVPSVLTYSHPSLRRIVRSGVEMDGVETFDDCQELWTVRYKDGEETGRVYVPNRVSGKLSIVPEGILVYRGLTPTANGARNYHRVDLLTAKEAMAAAEKAINE